MYGYVTDRLPDLAHGRELRRNHNGYAKSPTQATLDLDSP